MLHLGDITKIHGGEAPVVDVVIGGSPCQDLSIAGKRAGLAGARSGLYMEQIRIIKEMRERDRRMGRTGEFVRPRYMVWENVPGAFSSNGGKDFAAVLEEAIRIAEPEAPDIEVPEKGWNTWGGYHDEMGGRWSVAWRVLDAQHWGVPQRRRRIALVADFGGDTAWEILFERQSMSGYPAESGAAGEGPAADAESGVGEAGKDAGSVICLQGNTIDRADTAGCNGKGWKEDVCYTLNTIDRPAVCAGPDCLTPWDCQSKRVYSEAGVMPTLPAGENSGQNQEAVLCAGFKLGNSEHARSIGYAEEQAPTLNAECGGNKPAVMCLNDQGGNVMGVSHDVSGTLRAQEHGHQPIVIENHPADSRLKVCEDGVFQTLSSRMGTGGGNVPLVADVGFFNCYENTSPTLLARTYKDPHIVAFPEKTGSICAESYPGKLAHQDIVNGCYPTVQNGVQSVVRRLTPLECERLQGFPDHWTDLGEWTDSKGKRHKDADSPRYKALGNSIALPPWKWLLKRLCGNYERDATMASLFDGIVAHLASSAVNRRVVDHAARFDVLKRFSADRAAVDPRSIYHHAPNSPCSMPP